MVRNMVSRQCKGCKYALWLDGVAEGIRCFKDENRKYNSSKLTAHQPVLISKIRSCNYYEEK